MQKNKIAIITTRFGDYLNYFPLWLESVKWNHTIDFFLVTDKWKNEYNRPDNLKIIEIEFDMLKEKIQTLFSFKIILDRPYKITEYQPVFGILFKEELRNYTFWGYCDNDVILGNLRHFITDEILKINERVYFKDHMTLYQNNEKMRNLFRMTADETWDYTRAFQTRYICYFGEGTLKNVTIKQGIQYYNNEYDYADVQYKYLEFKLASGKNERVHYFQWYEGMLKGIDFSGKTKEYVYVHLQKRPMKMNSKNYNEGFEITPTEFLDLNQAGLKTRYLKRQKLLWLIKYYWKYRIKGRIEKIKYGAIIQRFYIMRKGRNKC